MARINADLVPDIMVSTGNGGGSKFRILDGMSANNSAGAQLTTVLDNVAFPQGSYPTSFNTPLRVAAQDSDGDDVADTLLAYQGTDGRAGHIRRFSLTPAAMGKFDVTAVDLILETSQFDDQVFNSQYINDFANAYFVATIKRRSVPTMT